MSEKTNSVSIDVCRQLKLCTDIALVQGFQEHAIQHTHTHTHTHPCARTHARVLDACRLCKCFEYVSVKYMQALGFGLSVQSEKRVSPFFDKNLPNYDTVMEQTRFMRFFNATIDAFVKTLRLSENI